MRDRLTKDKALAETAALLVFARETTVFHEGEDV
jgi:hypothetical protein